MRKDLQTIILRLLALVCFLLFCVMTLRTSVQASILGRYSLRYFIYLLTMLGLAICLGLLSIPSIRERILRKAPSELLQRKVNLIVCAGVFSIPVIYPLIRFISQGDSWPFAFRYMISVLSILCILALTVFLHRYRQLPTDFRGISWRWILLLLFLFHIVIIALVFGYIPGLDLVDEPFVTGNSILNARNFGSLSSLRPGERNSETWLNNPFMWVVSGSVQLLIGAGLLQARAFYLVIGVLTSPFVYLTAKRLYGSIAGWTAALLAFYIPLHHNWARAEIWVTTATAIAIYCYFSSHGDDTKRAKVASFACGFFIVSTIDGHFYGIVFAIMFCLLHLWEQLRHFRRYRWRLKPAFTYFILGCAAYSIFWLWYHVYLPGIHLGDIPRLFTQNYAWELQVFSTDKTGVVRILENVYQTLRLYIIRPRPQELLLYIFLVAMAIGRRRRADLILLSIFIGSVLIFFSISAHPNKFYYVFWMPFLAIWFGGFSQDICGRINSAKVFQPKRISNGALLFLVAVLTVYEGQAIEGAAQPTAIRNRIQLEDMIGAGRQLNDILPEEDIKIAGNFPFYLGMPLRLNYHGRHLNEPIFSYNWNAELPEALIFLLGYHERWLEIANYINLHSFVAAECIPSADLYSYFGWEQGQDFIAALFLHPDYAPDTPPASCTPEMLAWLDD